MPATATRHESPLSLHGAEHLRYIPALDGLRCVAVLLVFVLHYLDLKIGWVGVDIFFVLSGFLITSILWRSRDDPRRLRNFYLRRALRIFPLYYGVLFAIFFAAVVFQLPLDAERASWLVYLGNWSRYFHLGTSGPPRAWDRLASVATPIAIPFGHLWSLCVEEQFYLVWPVCLFALGARRRIVIACVAVVAAMPAVRFAALHLLPPAWVAADALYHLTLFRLDALLLGALLAMLLNVDAPQPKASRWAALALVSAFVLFAALAIGTRFSDRNATLYFNARWIQVIGYTLVDLMSAALIALACIRGSALAKLLSAPPLRWLGARSYGFYVFHFLILEITTQFLKRFTSSPPMVALVGFLLTLALTAASFRFYEQPFLKLKDRFPAISRPSRARPASSASEAPRPLAAKASV